MILRRYKIKEEFSEFTTHTQHPLKEYISYHDYLEMNNIQRFFYEAVGTPCQNHNFEQEEEIYESKVNVVEVNE